MSYWCTREHACTLQCWADVDEHNWVTALTQTETWAMAMEVRTVVTPAWRDSSNWPGAQEKLGASETSYILLWVVIPLAYDT